MRIVRGRGSSCETERESAAQWERDVATATRRRRYVVVSSPTNEWCPVGVPGSGVVLGVVLGVVSGVALVRRATSGLQPLLHDPSLRTTHCKRVRHTCTRTMDV